MTLYGVPRCCRTAASDQRQGTLEWSPDLGEGFGVGQQPGYPLALGSARTYAGQHRHLRYAPCAHCGTTPVGGGQSHLLSRRQRVWIGHAARGPPLNPRRPNCRRWPGLSAIFTAAPRLRRHLRRIRTSLSLTGDRNCLAATCTALARGGLVNGALPIGSAA
jgi:hypothetical protein